MNGGRRALSPWLLAAMATACTSAPSSPSAPASPSPPLPPPPPLHSEIFVERSPAAADGLDAVVVTVVVRDSSGKPVVGAPVTFDPGGATLEVPAPVTDGHGVAVALLTSASPMMAHVTATTPSGTLEGDATFAGGIWASLTRGMYGSLSRLAADPFRTNHLRGDAFGVFAESENGGLTYVTRPSTGGYDTRQIFSSHPPALVYAVNAAGCLGRSTDGGVTFSDLRCGLCGQLWVAPSDGRVVYADECPTASSPRTLARSSDAGATWQTSGPLPDGGYEISVAPDEPDTLIGTLSTLLGGNEPKLERSTDGGRTWSRIDGPLCACLPQQGVVDDFAVASANEIYAAVNVLHPNPPVGVVVTRDGGKTWTAPLDPQGSLAALNPPGTPYTNLQGAGLQAHPLVPGTVFLGSALAAFRSSDDGATWSPLPSDFPHFGFTFDSQDPQTMIHVGTTARTTDGGRTWAAPIFPPTAAWTISGPTVLGGGGLAVTTFSYDWCYLTRDDGAHWAPIRKGCYGKIPLAVAGGTGGTVLLAALGAPARVSRSTDLGATWTDVALPGDRPLADARAVTVSPDQPGVVYASLQQVVDVSADDGATWTSLAPIPGLQSIQDFSVGPNGALVVTDWSGSVWVGSRTGTFTELATPWTDCVMSPVDAKTILCVSTTSPTYSIARSTDGGQTFTTVLDGDQTSNGVAVAVPTFSRDGAAAFVFHLGAVYRSTDGGATWTKVAEAPPRYAAPSQPPNAWLTLSALDARVLYAGYYRIELPPP